MLSVELSASALISCGGSLVNDIPVKGDSDNTSIYCIDKYPHEGFHKVSSASELEIEATVSGFATVTESTNLIGTLFVYIDLDERIR